MEAEIRLADEGAKELAEELYKKIRKDFPILEFEEPSKKKIAIVIAKDIIEQNKENVRMVIHYEAVINYLSK